MKISNNVQNTKMNIINDIRFAILKNLNKTVKSTPHFKTNFTKLILDIDKVNDRFK